METSIDIWDYFDKNENGTAICRCGKKCGAK